MRNFVSYSFETDKLPMWLQEFLKQCKSGYQTRGELMTELEKAKEKHNAKPSSLGEMLD